MSRQGPNRAQSWTAVGANIRCQNHAYISQASVHYELGEYEAAIAGYTREIEINPKYALPYIARGGARNGRRGAGLCGGRVPSHGG